MYSDNDLLYYENKLLVERFNTSLFDDPSNRSKKSTAKGNLPINFLKKSGNPLTALTQYINCNSPEERVSVDSCHIVPPHHEFAYIKHCAVKTIEVFAIKLREVILIKLLNILKKK